MIPVGSINPLAVNSFFSSYPATEQWEWDYERKNVDDKRLPTNKKKNIRREREEYIRDRRMRG